MASGDRLYIADKATLDDVKVSVQQSSTNNTSNFASLHTKLGNTSDSKNTSSVFGFLKNIVDSLRSNAPTSISSADRFILRNETVSSSESSTILTLTGSGYLYVALTQVVSTGNPGTLRVIVDGNQIFSVSMNLSRQTFPDSVGIVHNSYLHYTHSNTTSYYVQPGRVAHTFSSSLIYQGLNASGTQSACVTRIPVPIRFKNSILVTVSGNNSIVDTTCVAVLD